jgi:hypothetical protein
MSHEQASPSSNLADQVNAEQPSLVRELCAFLMTNKKWWLTPIIVVFLLVGVLVLLSGTAAAPFIYTLF